MTNEQPEERRSRWDQKLDTPHPTHPINTPHTTNNNNNNTPTTRKRRWDQTPIMLQGNQTPLHPTSYTGGQETPLRKSKWDETPVVLSGTSFSDSLTATSNTTTTNTTTTNNISNGSSSNTIVVDRSVWIRNQPLSDEELNELLPVEGYLILKPPENYIPLPKSKQMILENMSDLDVDGMEDSTGVNDTEGLMVTMNDYEQLSKMEELQLPLFKPEDVQFFGILLQDSTPNTQTTQEPTIEEMKERKLLKLLIRIKNGTPQQRKHSQKQLLLHSKDFGPHLLLDKLLPLLQSQILDDQERHLFMKVLDRLLDTLGDAVKPYTYKLLQIFQPLLVSEEYYLRMEGRELIAHLSKAVGLSTMIATLRNDLDSEEEYLRNIVSKSFAVVSNALGLKNVLPFLRAVCKSRNVYAKQSGMRMIQQIAILAGIGVIPYLSSFIECIQIGLEDQESRVRVGAVLAISALAHASNPYGYESYIGVIGKIWEGVRRERGKTLAAYMKAFGNLLPLLEDEQKSQYVRLLVPVLKRGFESPDVEMKRILIGILEECLIINAEEVKELVSGFFESFWVKRMGVEKWVQRLVMRTTMVLADRLGYEMVILEMVKKLRLEHKSPIIFQKMIVECLSLCLEKYELVEESVVVEVLDCLMVLFQELPQEDNQDVGLLLKYIGSCLQSLSTRMKSQLGQWSSMILWRMNHKHLQVRNQAAQLIQYLARVIQDCGEVQLLKHLGRLLYEYLGEEYADVLASIINALNAVLEYLPLNDYEPGVGELLPRLLPIMKNRHLLVQRGCLSIIEKCAKSHAHLIPAREWLRLSFELVEMMKAPQKSLRRRAILTFGEISMAIGPQDLLLTLLNNLRVQERQNRICTTIAIAVVAERCGAFTILPALMNEYRTPEMNVQNGVLKALAFMFEYIGQLGKEYIYAVVGLLEDAMMDRDIVHRQIGCNIIQHLSTYCFSYNREDALLHLLNYVFPNLLEVAPHMITSYFQTMDALRLGLGAERLVMYLVQGLFHPARKVRDSYWRLWNQMYYGACFQLIGAYPDIDGGRYAMDYVL